MNLSHLEELCKEQSRKSYDRFIHSIDYNIFPITEIYIEACLRHIKEEFGGKVLSKYTKLHYFGTDIQIRLLQNTIDTYKQITLKYSLAYGVKNLNNL